jgi:hypothetical protein
MPCVWGALVSLVQDRTGQDGTADSIAWDRQTDRQTADSRTAGQRDGQTDRHTIQGTAGGRAGQAVSGGAVG